MDPVVSGQSPDEDCIQKLSEMSESEIALQRYVYPHKLSVMN